jgi:DNA repair protein RadA/Sms
MFVCIKCEEVSPVWHRECLVCGAEMALEKKVPLSDFGEQEKMAGPDLVHLPSGFPIFDRIFHGGFLQTFVYFIYAEKGAGKTTFLIQVCAYLVSLGKSVVFFSFDESAEGIKKKCKKYGVDNNQLHVVCENNQGIIKRTIVECRPDFVAAESLQSFAKYKSDETASILYLIRKEAQKRMFALVITGEERKDHTSFLGSTSIGHIPDVLIKMKIGLDEEVVISTPEKNRDTDDKTSRCFFRRTTIGLVEISEAEIGYLHRHREKAVLGRASFIARADNEFYIDEITAAIIPTSKKSTLTITGISNAKAKSILAVLENSFMPFKADFVLRANYTEKNMGDAELACMIAVLSLLFDKCIPVDTVFIGGVDNRGYLFPVEGMERRVRRADAQGYKRIIGPKVTGTQTLIWEEAETIEGVWQALGFEE